MTAKVVVEMSAKDADVVAAWQRAKNGVVAFDAELSKVLGTNARLEASGKRVWDQTRTPLERYNAEIEHLGELLQGNAIDQETYNRAAERQKGILKAAEESLKHVDVAQQALEASGKRVWEGTRTPLERYNAKLKELGDLLAKGTIDQDTYNRAVQEQNTILQNTDEKLRKIQEDNQKLEASGKRVWEGTRTPLERYNAAISETDALLKAGKISKETHTREIQRQKDLYTQATSSSKSYLSGLASGTAQVVAGIAGFSGIIGGIMAICTQLRAEYDNMVSRQKTAADRQIDTAAAQRAAIGNLGNDPNMTPEQLNEQIAAISKETGVSQKDLYDAVSGSLSARGQRSAQDAVNSVRVAALTAPDDVAGLKVMSGSLLDMQKKGDGTAEQNVGQFIAAKQAARVVSNDAFSQNVVPAVMGLQEFGDSPQQAFSIMAALTQGMGDTQGANARTAAIKLARDLEREMPTSKYPHLKSTNDRIHFLQTPAGKKIREKLIGTDKKKGTLDLEAPAYATIRGLLSGTETTQAKQLQTAEATIPELGVQSEKVFTDNLATINNQDIQKTASLNRTFKTFADNNSLKDVKGGLAAVTREGMLEALKSIGASKTAQDFISLRMEAGQLSGSDNTQFASNEFKRRAAELRTPRAEQTITGAGMEGASGDYTIPAYTPGQKEIQQSIEFQALADVLAKMVEQQARQTALQEKQLEAQQKANQNPINLTVQQDGTARPAAPTRDNTPTKPRPSAALNAGGA